MAHENFNQGSDLVGDSFSKDTPEFRLPMTVWEHNEIVRAMRSTSATEELPDLDIFFGESSQALPDNSSSEQARAFSDASDKPASVSGDADAPVKTHSHIFGGPGGPGGYRADGNDYASTEPTTSSDDQANEPARVIPARAEAVDVSLHLFSGEADSELVDAGRTKTIEENGKWRVEDGAFSGPQKLQEWLDSSIPRDGTQDTDDKRTGLLIETVLKQVSQNSDDPAQQVTDAYVLLNGLRHDMRTAGNSFSGDPALANAEHFFETAHRVAGTPFDGTATDLSGQVFRGAWTAPIWEALSSGYNGLKNAGLISGSNADNQHKWESSGIDYGMTIKEHQN